MPNKLKLHKPDLHWRKLLLWCLKAPAAKSSHTQTVIKGETCIFCEDPSTVVPWLWNWGLV